MPPGSLMKICLFTVCQGVRSGRRVD